MASSHLRASSSRVCDLSAVPASTNSGVGPHVPANDDDASPFARLRAVLRHAEVRLARYRRPLVWLATGAMLLSAMSGNLVCMALLPLGLALLGSLPPGIDPLALELSATAFVATSLIPLVLRRRLFSLSRTDLLFIARIQAVRVVFAIALYAELWHLLLPTVAIGWWIALAGLRQLVSRLPLVPGRDVLFAAIAGFFVGRHSEIAALLALFATLTMALQIAAGAVLGATGAIERTDNP